MPRLRTLYVGTKTVGDVHEEQYILVLDQVDPDQADKVSQPPTDALQAAGLPPILAFDYKVDIPEVDPARWVMPDGFDVTTHADAAQGNRVKIDVTRMPPILVFGRGHLDALEQSEQLHGNAGAEVTLFNAARPRGLPLGLLGPVVIRTPAYMALPDDHEGKKALEDDLRRATAA